jgi:hypothetical protein
MEYPIYDLVAHVFELLQSCPKPTTELENIESRMQTALQIFCVAEDSSDTETRFRQLAFDQFIRDRSIALTWLKNGMTLSGK